MVFEQLLVSECKPFQEVESSLCSSIDFFSTYEENIKLKMSDIRSNVFSGLMSFEEGRLQYDKWKNECAYYIYATIGKNDLVDKETRLEQLRYMSNIYKSPYRSCKSIEYYENFIAVKLMKRGNDVYIKYINDKLKNLKNICMYYPNVSLIEKSRELRFSNVLRIDLTNDINRGSGEQSAKTIGSELNLFLSNLKKQYGKISIFRVFEFTERGYCHSHLVVFFHKKRFLVKPMISEKNGKTYYRVSRSNKDKISKYWHSFINVYALENTKQLGYCFKYLSKEFFDHSKSITPYLLSLYSNRAYSMSKDLPDLLNNKFSRISGLESLRLDQYKYNSNYELTKKIFLGIFANDLNIDKWKISIKPPPFEAWGVDGCKLVMSRDNSN